MAGGIAFLVFSFLLGYLGIQNWGLPYHYPSMGTTSIPNQGLFLFSIAVGMCIPSILAIRSSLSR